MVAQSGGSYSYVKHVSGDIFEVTSFQDGTATVQRVNPAATFCSCQQPDCQHLWDAEHFLHDHECPACKTFSVCGMVCVRCSYVLAREQQPAVA